MKIRALYLKETKFKPDGEQIPLQVIRAPRRESPLQGYDITFDPGTSVFTCKHVSGDKEAFCKHVSAVDTWVPMAEAPRAKAVAGPKNASKPELEEKPF